MLKINEFAHLCGSNEYTLRYYDKIGLLKPKAVNKETGYRYYKKEQVLEYSIIKDFQDVGFSIDDIKAMKNLRKEQISSLIKERIQELEIKTKRALDLLNRFMTNELESKEGICYEKV